MPAPRDGAAARTRQRGHIAAARHLHQHRRAGLQRGARGPQRHRRQPGGARGRVALLRVAAVLERDDARRAGPHHRTRRHQIVRPAAAHQRLRLGGARVAADQRRAAQLVRAQHRHLAGVRVRRARLGQRVVAVVPHHHQTEIGDGREHRAAGADDQPCVARAAPTASGGSAAAGPRPADSADHSRLVDVPDGGRLQHVDVALIGHDGQHAAAGVHRHRRGLGKPVGPVLAGQRLPHRARGAALAQRGRNCSPRAVARPARRCRRAWRSQRRQLRRRLCFSTLACRGGTASRSTSARVPA